MGEVTRGSLEWPFENEVRWVGVSSSNETHRVMIYTKIGFLFDNHGLSDPEALVVQAQMVKDPICGCYLLAMWWEGVLSWRRCYFKPAETDRRLLVVELQTEAKTESVSFHLEGDPLSVQLFLRLVKAVEPTAKIGF